MKNPDLTYLNIANAISDESYATRSKVGAVIVKNGNILSFGYNGTPSGFDNACETEDGHTKPIVVHAEANAICKLAKAGGSSDGATIYCTHSPCIECAKLIIQAGITRVVFKEAYRLSDGLDLLAEANVDIKHLRDTQTTELPKCMYYGCFPDIDLESGDYRIAYRGLASMAGFDLYAMLDKTSQEVCYASIDSNLKLEQGSDSYSVHYIANSRCIAISNEDHIKYHVQPDMQLPSGKYLAILLSRYSLADMDTYAIYNYSDKVQLCNALIHSSCYAMTDAYIMQYNADTMSASMSVQVTNVPKSLPNTCVLYNTISDVELQDYNTKIVMPSGLYRISLYSTYLSSVEEPVFTIANLVNHTTRTLPIAKLMFKQYANWYAYYDNKLMSLQIYYDKN
jgi:dCMP deaminase